MYILAKRCVSCHWAIGKCAYLSKDVHNSYVAIDTGPVNWVGPELIGTGFIYGNFVFYHIPVKTRDR